MTCTRPFEVTVKTLTGLSLDLLVSPLDSVASLKHRLWQLQGIPTSQQQIVWQSRVVDDEEKLTDLGVKSGSVLHLLVALRGGPLNSSRRLSGSFPVDDADFVLELLDSTEDYLGDFVDSATPADEMLDRIDYLPGGDSHSVLVMFQDSDSGEISIYRVCPERDYSPLSEAADESPLRTASPSTSEGPSRRWAGGAVATRVSSAVRRVENEQTREKMRQLRMRMDALRSVRNSLRACSRSRVHETSASMARSESSRLGLLAGRSRSGDPMRSVLDQRTYGPTPLRASGLECAFAQATPSPQALKSSGVDSSTMGHLPLLQQLTDQRVLAQERQHLARAEPDYAGGKERARWPGMRLNSSSHGNSITSRPRLQRDAGAGNAAKASQDTQLSTALQRLQLHESVGSKDHPSFPREAPVSKHSKAKASSSSITSLPPLRVPRSAKASTVKKPVPVTSTSLRKQRCAECSKKLGLATTFTCRCGLLFCAQHRYSESHSCTFDYKTSGRQVLRHQNPVVTAVKLPKI